MNRRWNYSLKIELLALAFGLVLGLGVWIVVSRSWQIDKSVVTDDAAGPEPIDSLFPQVKKLTASDGAMGDPFGRSVAISGDTVVFTVGVCRVCKDLDLGGEAYVFAYRPTPR